MSSLLLLSSGSKSMTIGVLRGDLTSLFLNKLMKYWMITIDILSILVLEIYTPRQISWLLIYLWKFSIFFKYSVSKTYSGSFLLFASLEFSVPFSKILRVIGKQFEMLIIFPSMVPRSAPITTLAWDSSVSLFWACSNKFGKIYGWIRQCCCFTVLNPKLRFASIFSVFLVLSIIVVIVLSTECVYSKLARLSLIIYKW